MAQAGLAIIDLAISLPCMEYNGAFACEMAIADLIGKLCRTLRISNINCVSNCCNEQRSNSPDHEAKKQIPGIKREEVKAFLQTQYAYT